MFKLILKFASFVLSEVGLGSANGHASWHD